MRHAASGEIERGSDALRATTLGLLGAYLALSLYVLWRAAVLTPFSDELDWIRRWRDFAAHGDWSTYLLAPDNLHRLPWTFGLLALDIRLFGGTNAPLILSGALSLAVMALALARQAAKAAPAPLRLPVAALAAMLVLMAGTVLDASTPICVDYTHGAALAVLAVILAEGADPADRGWRRPLAVLTAIAAAFGDAAALAVWPALAWGALRRREWPWLAMLLVAGGVFVGLYGWGEGAEARGGMLPALQAPAKAAKLSLSYLALPWARLAPHLAWAGGLALVLASALLLRRRGGPEAAPTQRVAVGLLVFSLGTALMAGLGRSGLEDPAAVPLRYAVFLAPLHVALLIFAAPLAGRLLATRRRTAEGLVVGVLLAVAAQDVFMAVKVIDASDRVRETLVRFQQGRRTPEMSVFVHPDLQAAREVYAELRRDGLFQHELHLKPPQPAR